MIMIFSNIKENSEFQWHELIEGQFTHMHNNWEETGDSVRVRYQLTSTISSENI